MRLNRYPVIAILLIAGIFGIVFAYATVNLLQMAIANLRFLREFGAMAVMDGALWQLAEIVLSAFIALLTYIGFKICESELVRRYQDWQNRE